MSKPPEVTSGLATLGALGWAVTEPRAGGQFGGVSEFVQTVTSAAVLQTLAIAGRLRPQVIYVDAVTGQRFWALNESTFVSAGLALDFSVLNYVESGLLLPASGTLAAAAVTAGVGYVEACRVALPATAPGFTATRDNYVDLRRDGVLVVTPVTIAAAAPPIAANSMRLGFCTTDGTSVTSRTISAFDSLGNWMYNVSPMPGCKVARVASSGYGGAAIALPFPDANIFDNASMHDPLLNNTRITFPSNGIYSIDCSLIWFAPVTPASSYTLNVRLDGSITDNSFPEGFQGTQATQNMRCAGTIAARAGQYMEMIFTPNGASGAIDVTRLNVQRLA